MVAKEGSERNVSSHITSNTVKMAQSVIMAQSRTENALLRYIESSILRFRWKSSTKYILQHSDLPLTTISAFP